MHHTTRLLEPHYTWIAAGIVALILYGSFFPFRFYSHQDSRGLVGVLLDSGFQPASRDDVVSNILLYMPLGFFAVYTVKRRAVSGVAVAVIVGFLLSLTVELAQFYARGRVQELVDICSNTLGALLGASLATVARRWASSPFPTLLLACWLGNRWYPTAAPVSSIPGLDLFRYFVAWLAVGLILEALCGGPRSRAALPALLAVSLLVRTLAVNVEPAEIAGGAAAALLWGSGLWRLRARAKIAAALFVALVVLLALAPFEFSGTARAFGWVPFRSFLEASIGTAIRAFFEKAFFYSGMVWLLARAGLSAGVAAAIGVPLVLGLRLIQVYLPGRSAEITDAMLVLMFAGTMKLAELADPEMQKPLPNLAAGERL